MSNFLKENKKADFKETNQKFNITLSLIIFLLLVFKKVNFGLRKYSMITKRFSDLLLTHKIIQ